MIFTPNVKENNSLMHKPCGHINHFWESVSKAIENQLKGCNWQLQLDEAESELETRMLDIQNKIKACRAEQEGKVSDTDCRMSGLQL